MQPTDRNNSFNVRPASVADAAVIAAHRASMFQDMGTVTSATAPALRDMTIEYLQRALPSGEYLGWLMFETSTPEMIIGGAGLFLRQIPPFPIVHGPLAGTVAQGRQGIVMNVYVDRAWRRRGFANMLMQHVMDFARADGVESLVLHASKEGRPLYEQLGFLATNEMRLVPT